MNSTISTTRTQAGWGAAFEAWQMTMAIEIAFARDHLVDAWEKYWEAEGASARGLPCHGKSEAIVVRDTLQEQYERLIATQVAASIALLDCQAPDLDAAVVKLEILSTDERWEVEEYERHMALLLSDLRRLAAA